MGERFDWVNDLGGRQPIPLWIWGDDAQVNERNEKLTVVTCGFFLETRKDPKDTVYPLFTIRNESRFFSNASFFLILWQPIATQMIGLVNISRFQTPSKTEEISLGFESLQTLLKPVAWLF